MKNLYAGPKFMRKPGPPKEIMELRKQIELLTKRINDLQQQINQVRNPYSD